MTRPAVLDQVHAPQAVSAAESAQRLDVVIRVILRQADGFHPPGVDHQEDQDVDRAVADVLELLPLDPAGDRPPDRHPLQGLEVGDLVGTHDPDAASGQPSGVRVAPQDLLRPLLEPVVPPGCLPVTCPVRLQVHPAQDAADLPVADPGDDAIGDGLPCQVTAGPMGDVQLGNDPCRLAVSCISTRTT